METKTELQPESHNNMDHQHPQHQASSSSHKAATTMAPDLQPSVTSLRLLNKIEETRPLQVHWWVLAALNNSWLLFCLHPVPEPGPQLEWLEPDWMQHMCKVQECKAKECKAQECKAEKHIHGWLKNICEAHRLNQHQHQHKCHTANPLEPTHDCHMTTLVHQKTPLLTILSSCRTCTSPPALH
ncbi:hypothetical protein RSOL_019320, partial [Rhizoctonia solani AG-3 Rhs1AP]